MTSQSPAEAGIPSMEYADAWAATRALVMEQGFSWSGREKDHLFLNLGDGSFAEFSALSAADSAGDGRALALVDWDDDGRLDLLLRNRTAPRLQLFRNQMSGIGHFLALSLAGTRCNRDAIGAQVEVVSGGRRLRQTLHAGEGYLAQSSKRLHFGLGAETRIESVTVRWPDGSSDSYAGVEADGRYHLTQGDPVPRPIARRPAPALENAVASVPAPAPRRGRRIPLIENLPLGPLAVPAWEAPARKVSDLAGTPVLLNLWGRTCAACLGELGGFQERRKALDGAGVRIVTLCTDPPAEHEAARDVLRRFGLERDAGYADEALIGGLELVMKEVLGAFDSVPLPASLLLDRKGQMVCVYLGPVDVELLLADVESVGRMNPENRASTRLMGGMRLFEIHRDFAALARGFAGIGQPDLARFYRALTRE